MTDKMIESSNQTHKSHEDRRVLRSKRAIREALIELLRDKALRDITTTELCRKADINRNTFYTHYKSPFDVFEEIQEQYSSEIKEAMRGVASSSLYEVMCAVLATMKNKPAFSLLASQGADLFTGMRQEFVKMARESLFEEWGSEESRVSDEAMERTFTFITSGNSAVLAAWVRNGMTESASTIAQAITEMDLAAIRAGLSV